MSVNPGGGDGMLSYSDHDVHHVLHEVQAQGGENQPQITSDQRYEITERGLDPDELAELRAMRVNVGTKIIASQPQDSVGSQVVSVEAGFNLGGGDYLQTDLNAEGVDVDGDGSDDYTIRTRDTDEVGQIFSYFDSTVSPYDDDANGNGAGGFNTSNTEVINMADLFGSGPFVDSADDFTSRIRISETNQIQLLGIRAVYTLYYDVNQTEGGRSRFGR